jgi:hypothetical protein
VQFVSDKFVYKIYCPLLPLQCLPHLLSGYISYSFLQRVTADLFSQIQFLMYVQFIGFGIHQVSSSRKWLYRARDWNSTLRIAVRLEWTGRLMYDSRLPLRRYYGEAGYRSTTGPFHPPLRVFARRLQGTALCIHRLSSFIGARQCMTGSRLSQNDGRLLYLCCEVREKLTFREHNTESKETEDGGTSLMLYKVYPNL